MSVAKRNLVIYVLSTVSHVQLFTILVASSRRVILDGPWVTEYEQKRSWLLTACHRRNIVVLTCHSRPEPNSSITR